MLRELNRMRSYRTALLEANRMRHALFPSRCKACGEQFNYAAADEYTELCEDCIDVMNMRG